MPAGVYPRTGFWPDPGADMTLTAKIRLIRLGFVNASLSERHPGLDPLLATASMRVLFRADAQVWTPGQARDDAPWRECTRTLTLNVIPAKAGTVSDYPLK